MRNVFTDLTLFNGVESLFDGKKTADPWGRKHAGDLADMYVFSDVIIYPAPVRSADSPPGGIPKLVHELDREQNVIRARPYVSSEEANSLRARGSYMDENFEVFMDWLSAKEKGDEDLSKLRGWYELHEALRHLDETKFNEAHMFPVGNLFQNGRFLSLCKRRHLDVAGVLHAFDNVLRYPLYGSFAMEGESFYVNHEIRDIFKVKDFRCQRPSADEKVIPNILQDAMTQYASELATMDDYVNLLITLRRRAKSDGWMEMLSDDEDMEEKKQDICSAVTDVLSRHVRQKVSDILSKFLTVTSFALCWAPLVSCVLGAASAALLLHGACGGRVPATTGEIRWLGKVTELKFRGK